MICSADILSVSGKFSLCSMDLLSQPSEKCMRLQRSACNICGEGIPHIISLAKEILNLELKQNEIPSL